MEQNYNSNSDFGDIRQAREKRKSRSESYILDSEEGKAHKGDYLARLIFVQSIICALLVLITFSVKKFSPGSFEQLKVQYVKIMSTDMTPKEVWSALKSVSGFIVLPSDRWTAGDKDATTDASEENVTAATAEHSVADTLPQASQANPANDLSEPALTTALSDAGGEDIDLLSASNRASLAPYFTTVSAINPVKGKITSPFGFRLHPKSGKPGFHTGLDIAASQGTHISCAYYGTVKETGFSEFTGNYVLMEHQNGLQTFYCHCSEILVEPGAVIRAGETIAFVGSTGDSTGPHLHFEVRINGIRYNPTYILNIDDNKT